MWPARPSASTASILGQNAAASAPTAQGRELSLSISSRDEDPAWDDFLDQSPSGHHVQTSLWSQVKRHQGYRTQRLLARRGEEICGGVQLLISKRSIGKVAYAAKGPVVRDDDRRTAILLLDALRDFARRQRIRLLLVQPPDSGDWLTEGMPTLGFRPSPVAVCPAYTTKVDLNRSEDELLAGLKQKTRYNLRVARRMGLSIREGTADDIPAFHQMMEATGTRQQFAVFDAEYYRRMWSLFHRRGAVRLSFAEHEGTAIAAQILIAFGETALYKMGVWSGTEGHRHPNELLHWSNMMWARERGFCWYDLDGISSQAGEVVSRGERPSRHNCKGLDVFKLSLGGDVFQVPPAFDYLPNPALRIAFRKGLPLVSSLQAFRRLVHWMRTRGSKP